METAYDKLADSMASWQRAGNVMFGVSTTFVLADIRTVQGRLSDAIYCYQQALQYVSSQGQPRIKGTAEFHIGLSELFREQGNTAKAQQHLQQSLELGEASALLDWQYRLRLAQARAQQSQGDFEAALEFLDEAEQVYYATSLPITQPLAAIKARIWIQQGKLAEAVAWARAQGLTVDDELSYLREYEHITLARLLVAQHRVDDAANLLTRLLAAAETSGRMGSALEILILQALQAHTLEDTSAGLEPLTRALTLAEPEGYVRLFVDEGRAMKQLLLEAKAQGILPNYVSRLLTAFKTPKQQVVPSAISDDLIEALSPRELEVLHLIAEGLSNQAIAKRLSLSLSTIKGHNRNIFGKLLVQRRTEAVAKARALSLI